MREIKFRCWIDYGPGHCTMLHDRGNLSEFFDAADGNPIMQHTGLKDKNGKEIYEGDIVKFFDKISYEIKFGFYDNGGWYEDHESGYGWYLEDYGVIEGIHSEDIMTSCEIIGNIYENPELLSK